VRSIEVNEGRGSASQGDRQMDVEHGRLEEARIEEVPWRKWGPYLYEYYHGDNGGAGREPPDGRPEWWRS
jgi:hypothetical protein